MQKENLNIRVVGTATAELLAVNLILNLVASICFKEGGTDELHRWPYFIGGNIVGASSIYYLMKIYEQMPDNCNVALVLAGGGAFIGTQIALALVFRSRLSVTQWADVVVVAIGSAAATLGGPSVAP
jgi:small multidrug resistance pump